MNWLVGEYHPLRAKLFSQKDNLLKDQKTFEENLEAAFEIVNQYLITVLKTKYKFINHCEAMKRYLLLGQGDFITYLMDLIKYHLLNWLPSFYAVSFHYILITSLILQHSTP